MKDSPRFVNIEWGARTVRIEHQWVGTASRDVPLIVFLHEGLGSLAMWKDFPRQLCAAAGCRGLVYSRPGYGRSTPRPKDEDLPIDFMHVQAYEVLPALFAALKLDTQAHPPWLLGHSDGGSIALLFAAGFASRVAGLIVLAPHIVVEERSVASIDAARLDYLQGNLRQRLAPYHDDADSAFWGWNRAWLAPEFRAWSIAAEITTIRCPVLAVQGVDDEYGTLEQIRGIAKALPQTELLALESCGHSPQRDRPAELIQAATRFIRQHSPGGPP